MKKLVLLLLLVHTAAFAFSQNNKWFFSLGTNKNIGGPKGSYLRQFREQGFNSKSENSIIWVNFSRDYPYANKFPNLMLHAGRKLDEKKSLYISCGIADYVIAEGFKQTGYDNNPILGGSTGKFIDITSLLYQASVGYMYSVKSRMKWGVAPSLFLLHYTIDINRVESSHTAVMGGVTLTSRIPLGREKRLVGVDLFTQLNLAPPVNIKADQIDAKDFKGGTTNLVYGSIGLAMSFRR